MPCQSVTLPTGQQAIVCGRGVKRPACACGRPAPLLCDRKTTTGTCDAPICSQCATSVGEGLDYCKRCASMPDDAETLVCVDAPHFCAAVVLKRGVVVRAAPILKWALGWTAPDLSAYFRQKAWKATQRRLTSDDTLEREAADGAR